MCNKDAIRKLNALLARREREMGPALWEAYCSCDGFGTREALGNLPEPAEPEEKFLHRLWINCGRLPDNIREAWYIVDVVRTGMADEDQARVWVKIFEPLGISLDVFFPADSIWAGVGELDQEVVARIASDVPSYGWQRDMLSKHQLLEQRLLCGLSPREVHSLRRAVG